MASSASVLEDGTWLSRLDRHLFKLETFFALLSGLAVFALMILAVVSVGGRNFFGAPIRGYVDWIEQAMPLIAFMGIAYTQRLGGHIRMDMLVGALSGRALWLFELITTFLIFVLIALLVWGSWAHFDRSVDFVPDKTLTDWIGAARTFTLSDVIISRDSTLDIGLPRWPTKFLVPLAFGVMALRLILQMWGYSRALWLGLESPVAVPLIESVAEAAAREAETVTGAD